MYLRSWILTALRSANVQLLEAGCTFTQLRALYYFRNDEHNSRSFGCGSAFEKEETVDVGLRPMKARTPDDTQEGLFGS